MNDDRLRLRDTAAAIARGDRDPLEGAIAAWKIALAAAAAGNQSVRAWFSRTAEQEAIFRAPRAHRALLDVGREAAALAAIELVDAGAGRRNALSARAADASRRIVENDHDEPGRDTAAP